jgi:hypothetical protein
MKRHDDFAGNSFELSGVKDFGVALLMFETHELDARAARGEKQRAFRRAAPGELGRQSVLREVGGTIRPALDAIGLVPGAPR